MRRVRGAIPVGLRPPSTAPLTRRKTIGHIVRQLIGHLYSLSTQFLYLLSRARDMSDKFARYMSD